MASVDGAQHVTRKYQEEMLNESVKRNIIVVLDTGSGKTLIAALRLKLEVERQASLGTRKVSWFLVPTVALCQQQSDVLKKILPCGVDYISGGKEPDKWTNPALWRQIVTVNQVIVSTHQVLLDALRHAYLNLGRDIGLLIFDEAHHALRGHPYNRIMREFYDPLPAGERPHILGLTASPMNVEYVDRYVGCADADDAGRILEQNLMCRALTTQQNEEELKTFVFPPTFKHVVYRYASGNQLTPSLRSLETVYNDLEINDDPFVRKLRRDLNQPGLDELERQRIEVRLAKAVRKKNTVTHETMKKLLSSARDTFFELGPWATDWFIAHSVDKLRRPIDASQEFSFFESKRSTEETRYLREVLGEVYVARPAETPEAVAEGLAPQTEALIRVLLEEKETAQTNGDPYSGIIFVTLRTAALLLAKVISLHPATRDKFRVGHLVGWSNDERRRNVLDLLVGAGSEQEQEHTLENFRSGELDLLVATSVLEEGVDVPICGSIVRFNPPPNITSWVQSRGRARAQRSSFVVMFSDLARGDETVEKWQRLEDDMNAKYKAAMRERAVGEPQKEGNQRHFKVEETGALLTLDNATSHISHFCDKLPHSAYARMVPIYDVFPPDGFMEPVASGQHLPPLKTESKLFGCTLTLPNVVPRELRKFETPMIHLSEKAAKRQVAFEAYQRLFHAGLVNPNLLPLRPADDPELKAMTGPSEKRQSMAAVVSQMDAWKFVSDDLRADEYWRSDIEVEGVGKAQMYTKVQPPLAITELTLYDRVVPHRIVVRSTDKVTLSEDEVRIARASTRQLWWSVYGRHMSWDRTDFVHFFIFPWEEPGSSWRPEWAEDTLSVPLPDIVDRFGLITDLFTVRDSRNAERSRYEWYNFQRWRMEPLTEDEAKDLEKRYPRVPEDEPLEPPFLEVVKLRRQANHFAPDDTSASQKSKIRILHPRFCLVDLLPPALGRLSLFLPSILRDMQATVIGRHVHNRLFAGALLSQVPLLDARTAITTPLTGDLVNYQRVETLGDCALKFLTSVQLLDMHPDWHEGYLTMAKDHVVSNANLARAAVHINLAQWIIRDRVVARKWHPPLVNPLPEPPKQEPATGAAPTGKKKKENQNQDPTLSTKVLADVVESLIGAAYENCGYDAAIGMLQHFIIGVPASIAWKPVSERVRSIVNRIEPLPNGYPEDYVHTLEDILGHKFNHPSLLLEALTHANYTGDVHTVSYERLEFLGDSLLDNVVTERVYRSPRRLPPVLMTRCRIATVNTEILAFCCASLCATQDVHSVQRVESSADGAEIITTQRLVRLPTFLRMSNIAMLDVVRQYTAGVERAHADIQEKLLHGKTFPWTELFSLRAPKFLGDIVESLIGAIYLDTNGDMTACERFVERLGILPVLRHLIEDEVDVRHPLTVLGEHAAKSQGKLKYAFVSEGPTLTCSISLNGELIVSMEGDSGALKAREELKVRAAAQAYNIIKRRLASTAST
ncbi:P-loop containing nucleoside triphosphate hydrolase protein [Exidia glandulosa HHB12029]|uniref:p-loop containing nucleoside triphosphate hydrolase protein n=1 Tax=Exidia glandulosa HHB12029 TaxID=1314781 RepID=A0A165JHT3_EXIGL|nr:P-loop containing nucleoside triphosphate hydrolase protein [Exidia glandulosa HHB12029]